MTHSRHSAGTPAGGRFAATDRPEAETSLARCRNSGEPIKTWSAKLRWPPVRQVAFGDEQMTGMYDCWRCGTAQRVTRRWKRGSALNASWVFDDHDAAPHTMKSAASSS